jgi:hypothetical protein
VPVHRANDKVDDAPRCHDRAVTTTAIVLASENAIGDLERDGLWLIAVGALIVGGSLFAQGPLRGPSGRPQGAVSDARDRFLFACAVSGALLVALGSFLVVVAAMPDVWIVVASFVGVVGAVYAIGVRQVRRDTRLILSEALTLKGPPSTGSGICSALGSRPAGGGGCATRSSLFRAREASARRSSAHRPRRDRFARHRGSRVQPNRGREN